MIIQSHIKENFYPVLLQNLPLKAFISLTLFQNEDAQLEQLQVKISLDGDYIIIPTISVAAIPAFTQFAIQIDNYQLQNLVFRSLTETTYTNIKIEIIHNESIIAQESKQILIHPLDSFPGGEALKYLPSFIMPNHKYVYLWKQKCIPIMQRLKYEPAFEGYQSNDKQRIIEMLTAVFYMLKEENWVYSALSPSFETNGQRLRLIDQIQELKFGNCIDISLAIAGILEAMSLHPIIITIPGHAFVGCWLEEQTFEMPIVTHKNELTSRIAKGIQEIVVFEATSICLANTSSFKESVQQAEALLRGTLEFTAAIDVKLSRILGVKPMNMDWLLDTEQQAISFENNKESNIDSLTIKIDKTIDLDTLTSSQITKQQIWERKLLDFSMRNNFLNLRLTNNTIQLVNISLNPLINNLLSGKTYTISNTKAIAIAVPNRTMIDSLHESEQVFEYAAHEGKQHRLLSAYNDADMLHVLTHIQRNNQLALEESGANTLYLTLGTLRWIDPKNPESFKQAPIILIPVEIKRNSIISKFSIKFRDEDIQLNTTLIEFLLQEFQLNLSNLKNYLEDEEEEWSAQVIFNTIRKAIIQHKDWVVEELIFLSNFNFKTQVIWKDIHENMGQLVSHPIINGLVNLQFTSDRSLERHTNAQAHNYELLEHISPITADSSQMEAIIAANEGKSFVLHGPPGTGKSQTITNIIANFLYHNKTVLFVASKKAALDVVHNRLVNIGLEHFTLELHSNKAKKSDVLQHFGKTLEQLKIQKDDSFQKQVQQYQQQRFQLDNILAALHKQQSCGMSIYELVNKLAQYDEENKPPHWSIPARKLQSLHPQLMDQWRNFMQEFAHEPLLQTNITQHPLVQFSKINYYLGLEEEVQRIDTQKIIELENHLDNIINVTNYQQIKNINELSKIIHLLALIKENAQIPIKLLDSKLSQQLPEYQAIIDHQLKQDKLKETIFKYFNNNILDLNILSIKTQWQAAQNSWFLPKYFKTQKVSKILKSYAHYQPFPNQSIGDFIEQINQIHILEKTINNKHNQILISNISPYKIKDDTYKKLEESTAIITQILETADSIGAQKHLLQLAKDLEHDQTLTDLLPLLTDWIKAANIWENIQATVEQFASTFILTYPDARINTLVQNINIVQNNTSAIAPWYHYTQTRNKGNDLGLSEIIETIEQQENNAVDNNKTFTYNLLNQLLQYYVQENVLLRTFSGKKMEQLMQQFQNLHVQLEEITKKVIYLSKLHQLPNTSFSGVDNSELTILQRAIRSRGRNWSIRNLFSKTPQIMPKLAPCILMSPISVAQYLDINLPKFDLVIFDEASQLPTAEAISAIGRGKQVIVVGDPKQMPPTSFFSKITNEEDLSEIDDLESIIDDTLSINTPSKYLLRHYRSQHESLIAYSNAAFYDHSLFTFPSVDDLHSKVSLIHVPGYYDKGKTRQNVFEAQAIVQEVQRLLTLPNGHEQSIGIVTFSQTQQQLIEDMLDELYAQYPEIEHTAHKMVLPIFVKNLENVQGDERDIILFSIGYAADKDGQISMNFGPLNKNGGWRRLNVAITRAKHEMKIFATLRAEQIDISKTQAQGVLALKGFLEFANGLNPIASSKINTQQQSAVVLDIGNYIQNAGYQIQYAVGQSHFKIDIAIVHPKYKEQYILGISLDSPQFAAAGNATDRFIIIPQVLHGLRWNILPIWTLDWHYQKAQIQQHLLDYLHNLAQQKEFVPTYTPVLQTPIAPFQPAALQAIAQELDVPEQDEAVHIYTHTELANITQTGAELFLRSKNKEIVKNQIIKIVHHEAPISSDFLQKKLMQLWRIARSGARIERYIHQLINETNFYTEIYGTTLMIWRTEQQKNTWSIYRKPIEAEKRNVEDIAAEEIAVCLQQALRHHLNIDKESAYRYLQKTLLNSRYNQNYNILLEQAITEIGNSYDILLTTNGFQYIQK